MSTAATSFGQFLHGADRQPVTFIGDELKERDATTLATALGCPICGSPPEITHSAEGRPPGSNPQTATVRVWAVGLRCDRTETHNLSVEGATHEEALSNWNALSRPLA